MHLSGKISKILIVCLCTLLFTQMAGCYQRDLSTKPNTSSILLQNKQAANKNSIATVSSDIPPKNKKWLSYNEIVQIRENEDEKLTKIYFEEYKKSIDEFLKDLSPLSLSKAMINSVPFYNLLLTGKEEDFFRFTTRMFEEMPPNSTVYSGITNDGVQIIALIQPVYDESYPYYGTTVSKLRGDSNEMNMFKDISKIGNNSCFAIDIYMNDIYQARNECKIQAIRFLSEDGITRNGNKVDVKYQDKLKEVVTKYGRNLDQSNIIKDRTWRLFTFNGNCVKPNTEIKNILVDIYTVTDDGPEQLTLSRNIWTDQ